MAAYAPEFLPLAGKNWHEFLPLGFAGSGPGCWGRLESKPVDRTSLSICLSLFKFSIEVNIFGISTI